MIKTSIYTWLSFWLSLCQVIVVLTRESCMSSAGVKSKQRRCACKHSTRENDPAMAFKKGLVYFL